MSYRWTIGCINSHPATISCTLLLLVLFIFKKKKMYKRFVFVVFLLVKNDFLYLVWDIFELMFLEIFSGIIEIYLSIIIITFSYVFIRFLSFLVDLCIFYISNLYTFLTIRLNSIQKRIQKKNLETKITKNCDIKIRKLRMWKKEIKKINFLTFSEFLLITILMHFCV